MHLSSLFVLHSLSLFSLLLCLVLRVPRNTEFCCILVGYRCHWPFLALMVSVVPLQRRRTEAAVAVAARSIFPESRQEEQEEEGMDLSGTQGELPIPMHTASPYGGIGGGGGGGHVLEFHHDHANDNGRSQSQALPSPPAAAEEKSGKKRAAEVVASAGICGGGGGGPAVKYQECLKNHAAAIGGNATDGCGEFMPSGEEGSLEALKCSACGCHRNFHRKELDDFDGDNCAEHGMGHGHRAGRRLLGPAMPHHRKNGGGGGLLVTADPYGAYSAARALPPPPPPSAHHQIIMPLNMIHTSESDEMDGGGGAMGGGSAARSSGGGSSSKKRFRTKFTAEQKARMLDFAERVGWRLQKLDDAVVQHFCQEIGVKRRVLKVWMHNNKHNLAKKPLQTSPQSQPQQPHHPMPVPMPSPPMPMPPSQPGPSCHRSPSSPSLPLKLE